VDVGVGIYPEHMQVAESLQGGQGGRTGDGVVTSEHKGFMKVFADTIKFLVSLLRVELL
jgi:hypothetical protein